MYSERASQVRGAVVWTWMATVTANRSRVLPDGCMDVIWRDGRLLVAGPDTRAYEVTEAPGVTYVGVRLAPGVGPSVLGVPADELRDRRVPLDEIWAPGAVRRIEAQMDADVGAALERLTARRLGERTPDPATAAAIRALGEGTGVADVSRRVGLSERQLHRRVVSAVGYGPKTLARVLRLNQAIDLARGGRPLADVAAEAGYADQAHLAHDVKAFAGRPITAVLAGV